MSEFGAEHAVFAHPLYSLENDDKVTRKPDAPPAREETQMSEEMSVIEAISAYVTNKLKIDYQLEDQWIPADDVEAKCSVLVSQDWMTCEKLLLIIQNAVGSQMGIWSRTLCLEAGLRRGSMLPYVDRARSEGWGVVILRPNANSVYITPAGDDESSSHRRPVKTVINGSASPEDHCMFVWNNMICQHTQAQYISLLGYGNGAMLCKEILTRQMVRTKESAGAAAGGAGSSNSGAESNRICCIATVEASQIIEEDDALDVRHFLAQKALNWESSIPTGSNSTPTASSSSSSSTPLAPAHFRLPVVEQKLGVTTISLGPLHTASSPSSSIGSSVAWSMLSAIDQVFPYMQTSLAAAASSSGPLATPSSSATIFNGSVARSYAASIATKHSIPSPGTWTPPTPPPTPSASSSSSAPAEEAQPESGGFFSRLFGFGNKGGAASGNGSGSGSRRASSNKDGGSSEKLTIADFELMKVVGKGAFGKVMLVKKKGGNGDGKIYAMKVLKKSVVASKGQIEHTKSERAILCEIRHPFVVRLRFAFQNEEKLYLVTDYYNGGSLFYHLRKCRAFPEERAKYYAAELLSALDHLHQQQIIYRDLKLENVLMDSYGHIALTDFGLSKQAVGPDTSATTFCGTAEYIAPELLKGQRYGPGVDWWSFGILLYEMMAGRTPFYDKNRKLMFYKIVNTAPFFPPTFTQEACDVIRGLLTQAPEERLGHHGADAIKRSAFFAVLDFQQLDEKLIPPPFTPEVVNEVDTKYVPKAYLEAAARDSDDKEKAAAKDAAQFDEFTYLGDSAMA